MRHGRELIALAVFAGVALLAAVPAALSREPPNDFEAVPLTDDVSRADLAWRDYRAEHPGLASARPLPAFEFPTNANDGVYGIDVSHHNEDGNGPIAWPDVASQSVFFVYAKATQGRRYYDSRFERTWAEIAKLRDNGKDVYRGAYHFLESGADPVKQAGNFLSAIGTLDPKDLPPCVDIEWHVGKGPDGETVDLWNSYSESVIVEKLAKFIQIIEAATGRKPIIYTAKSWWKRNIPTSKQFENYPIWIADYGPQVADPNTPVERLEPRVMDGHKWAIWQFTDSGKAKSGGLPGKVDVNFFRGSTDDFKRAFGLIPVPPAPPAPPPVEQPTPVPPAETPAQPPQPPAPPSPGG